MVRAAEDVVGPKSVYDAVLPITVAWGRVDYRFPRYGFKRPDGTFETHDGCERDQDSMLKELQEEYESEQKARLHLAMLRTPEGQAYMRSTPEWQEHQRRATNPNPGEGTGLTN